MSNVGPKSAGEGEQAIVQADGDRMPLLALSVDDRLYDFFKHMTTLSLVSLGGIMTIASEKIVEIPAAALATVVGLVAIGGIGAYSGMGEIIQSKMKGDARPKRIAFYRGVSSLGFGMGIGAFLSVFLLGLF
ncbi:hypothetical protein HME9302_00830 [Alteripontixanthobacter maritimus]|uniref:Uncharacterized protein n=1 Tax=Alteripontixanthobacter maritimus TaxID=2161824 RepID=A0A369Q5E1_9SPHN|nr:hypothetical protein [Alteripontixanthobacter maritimus]RDC59640.1 hypothetical protein HME9302_00830 [Alteripontixanthobacter maritimus]